MNPQSACEIGMIPFHLKDKIVPVGNAAGEGAKIALINEEELLYADKLAKKISFVELAASEDFQDCFVDNLEFPDFLNTYMLLESLSLPIRLREYINRIEVYLS